MIGAGLAPSIGMRGAGADRLELNIIAAWIDAASTMLGVDARKTCE